MSKKRNGLIVQTDLVGIFNGEVDANPNVFNRKSVLTIEKALEIVVKQMGASGMRERTIHDYETYVTDFIRKTDIDFLLAIDADSIYDWLSQMNVKDTTKRIRLKCFCAFLGKCFNNGWLSICFGAISQFE